MNEIKVLFADDDYMICDIVELLLAGERWLPIIAHNGEEAYALYREKRPHVIILDVAMPVLSGLEVAEKIREHDKNTPIIFYTGMSNDETMRNILLTGVNQMLMKNFSAELIIEMVRNALNLQLDPSRIILEENVFFDSYAKVLYVNSTKYRISPQQAAILCELAKCMNKEVDYNTLCNRIWGEENSKLYYNQLRKKVSELNAFLKDKSNLRISNIRNRGYALVQGGAI